MVSSNGEEAAAGRINPLLLASARLGSWEALDFLLGQDPPMVDPTEEFLRLLHIASARNGVQDAGDIEQGIVNRPASSAAGKLLQGVTTDGDTVLHAVARNGDDENFRTYAGKIFGMATGLLFQKNYNGDTPLHCAARAGKCEMVTFLVDLAGRDGPQRKLALLRLENKGHETALHEAVRFEDGRVLVPEDSGALFDADGEPEEIKVAAFVEQQRMHIVKKLMADDPRLANHPVDGISPLYLAILLGKSTIALTLYVKSGGNPSYSGADGKNALHVAILRHTDTVMVKCLLKWKRSLACQLDKDGSTPLHFASAMWFWTKSYVDFQPLTKSTWWPFLWCPFTSTQALAMVIQANPAALYQADKNGIFPIHLAASVGAINTISHFLSIAPNNAELRDAKGKTFLHIAIEKRMLNIVSYVCREPSLAWILNMQDNQGNTALHLVIEAGSFRMFCALFGNPEVNLNITNNHGETPLESSLKKTEPTMSYRGNSEIQIRYTLKSVRANTSALRWDKADERCSRPLEPEDQEKESERLKDATQRYIVASVLIANMAFSATFAIPGGYRADDRPNGGTPTLSGVYIFDAFIMATALALICSLLATTGFMLAGIPMVSLITRKNNFYRSTSFFSSSVTCMSIAFALGVYMVLAPVASQTAVAICVITPAIIIFKDIGFFSKLIIREEALCSRIGRSAGIILLLRGSALNFSFIIGPIIVIFGWGWLAKLPWIVLYYSVSVIGLSYMAMVGVVMFLRLSNGVICFPGCWN